MKNYKIMVLAATLAVVFYLANAAGQAVDSQASSNGMKSAGRKGLPLEMVISADELRRMQLKKKNFILLDARGEKNYEEAHIQGALLPLSPEYYRRENLFKKGIANHPPDAEAALRENMKQYSKDMPIVTYCSSGGCQASAVLALQIKRLGFNDVRAMEDGIQTWDKKGYPVRAGKENERGRHE